MSDSNTRRAIGMATSRRVQVYLAAVIVALVAAALYTYWMVERREQSLDSLTRHSVTYSASRAAVALQQLELALLRFDRTRAATDRQEVGRRLESLSDRASALEQGEFAAFVEKLPAQARVVEDLRDGVRAIDRTLAEAGTDLDVQSILARLGPLEPKLIDLAAEANRFGIDRLTLGRQALAVSERQFSVLSFGLIIAGLCLVGALIWHNRLLSLAHHDLSLTTSELTRAADELAAANLAVAAANAELRRQNGRLSEKEQALKDQNMLFDAALNNMSQGLCMFDDGFHPIVWNRRFEELFPTGGMRPRTGVSLHEIVPDLATEIERNGFLNRVASFEKERRDGRVVAVAQQPMPGGGWVATFDDVTEARRAQARIAHMARHDVLTNLPNRYAFRERIKEELAVAADDESSLLAVMCVDLDNFKKVNDALGHPVGDGLLCAVAERLAGTVRETDMVARFGGDEFAILQPRITRIEEADHLASRLVDELCKPFLIDGEQVFATGSIGVAIFPKHGGDPDALQKNADLALYAAKADGKRTYRFFEHGMDERLTIQRTLERDLRHALSRGEFALHYQPIVNLRTSRITGFEALLRWRHPMRGDVPPSVFIPVAEEAGLIGEIGRWVLERACADAAGWPAHLKISVNLSVAQFTRGDIVEDIRSALSRGGLRPERLIVEITETLLLTEDVATRDTLNRLKALNIAIAMDDFGTGYSSLSYLRQYSFDRIKIDRNFVTTSRGRGTAIIRAIVQLGQSLGMITVAEGVESEEDLEMLRSIGCLEGQGYFFSPPVPLEKAQEMIAADEGSLVRIA